MPDPGKKKKREQGSMQKTKESNENGFRELSSEKPND